MNSAQALKAITLVLEEEEQPRKPAYLKDIRVKVVALVDDPAVPKAEYEVVKMDDTQERELELEEFESTETNETSNDSTETNKEESGSLRNEELLGKIDLLIQQNEKLTESNNTLTESLGLAFERLDQHEGLMNSINERLPEITQVEDQPNVDMVDSDVADPSTEGEVEVIDEASFESLKELATNVFDSYESGEITEEEFELFNSELETVLEEVS
tara:strand:+ start:2154 stop:2798 length:645 start_codon:yes stop_codon:yes gene_type:complete